MLPTKVKLAYKFGLNDLEYPLCGCDKEDWMHILVKCSFVKAIYGLEVVH